MCCREKKGTNLGPRHIRQNWFIVTIVQAVLCLIIWPNGQCQYIYCLCSYLVKKKKKKEEQEE